MASFSSKRLYHGQDAHDVQPSSELAIRLQYAMIEKYPAKTHARRVAEALGVHHGLIALSGSPNVLWANSDQGPPFRQERYFYYLTGCNEPGCYVTYDIRKDELTLWLAPIDEKRVVWTGRGSTVEEALEKYDIDHAKYLNNQKRPTGLDNADTPACELLERFVTDYMEQADCVLRVWTILSTVHDSKLKALISRARPSGRYDLRAAMDNCRVIKDDYEIMLIRKASEITAKGHKAVLSRISRLKNEAEVEAEYMRVCIANHAREQAYAPIAGSGPNAAELHYGKNNQDFGERQMMVLDAGCEYECYASDVTRTIPLNKQNPGHWPSKEAEDVYKIVERIQEACIAEMKPGNSFAQISLMSFEMTLDGLMELGILKGRREDIRKVGTQFAFFPHGLGHHMGLEVHDVGARPPPREENREERCDVVKDANRACNVQMDAHRPVPICSLADLGPGFPRLPRNFDFSASIPLDRRRWQDVGRCDKCDPAILKPGMVITIEPGMYFNRFLIERFFLSDPAQKQYIDQKVLDRYWKVGGVRIEDDILITKDGHENLTTAPKGEEMLDFIRKASAASVEE